MRGCNGVCGRHKVKRPKGSDWDAAVKWCGACEVSILVEGFVCPCCKSKLRTNSKTQTNNDDKRY